MTRNVHFISLGCPKNLVDSELMLGDLLAHRYTIVHDPTDADVLIVNTCSFIELATQESIDTILDVAQYKDSPRRPTLVVAGCLAQRHASQLEAEIPEVDYFVGTGEYHRLSAILEQRPLQRSFVAPPTYIHDEHTPRAKTGNAYSAYLKLSEGCNHRCTFCIIPSLRGPLRSRTVESLVKEASHLVDNGVVELNLISQDTNAFGSDLHAQSGHSELARLLEALSQLEPLRWIRLLYLYPMRFPESLIEVIAHEPKVVKYIDMPLQHINKRILGRMKRGVGGARCRRLVHRLRERIPGLVLRTSFIVGFPGETAEEFDELVDFVKEVRFERMGVFTFSPEEGAPATRMRGQVPRKVMNARRRRLMAIQRRVSRRHNEALVGETHDVLIEGLSDETDLLLQGRLPGHAPEIDGHVLINEGRADVGSIVPVRLTRALDYDLIGGIVDQSKLGFAV